MYRLSSLSVSSPALPYAICQLPSPPLHSINHHTCSASICHVCFTLVPAAYFYMSNMAMNSIAAVFPLRRVNSPIECSEASDASGLFAVMTHLPCEALHYTGLLLVGLKRAGTISSSATAEWGFTRGFSALEPVSTDSAVWQHWQACPDSREDREWRPTVGLSSQLPMAHGTQSSVDGSGTRGKRPLRATGQGTVESEQSTEDGAVNTHLCTCRGQRLSLVPSHGAAHSSFPPCRPLCPSVFFSPSVHLHFPPLISASMSIPSHVPQASDSATVASSHAVLPNSPTKGLKVYTWLEDPSPLTVYLDNSGAHWTRTPSDNFNGQDIESGFSTTPSQCPFAWLVRRSRRTGSRPGPISGSLDTDVPPARSNPAMFVEGYWVSVGVFDASH